MNNLVISVVAVACLLAGGSVFAQFDSVSQDGLTFSVSQEQLPWAQAVNACETIGQKLVSVESPAKDDLLVQLFVEQRNNNGSN